MNENVRKTCDMILENRTALRKSMFWELDGSTYATMAGILSTAKGVEADPAVYKECKKILRSNVSFFSSIRGIIEAIVAVKMMSENDKEGYIQGVQEVYKKLRKVHVLTASPYMVMAAMNIYESKGLDKADEEIERLESLYKGLKAKHPFLVTDSDRGYLSMLISMDIDVEKALEDIEANYTACKKLAINDNTVYTLAQVLALSDKSPEENNEFVKNLIDGLKNNKKRINKRYGLSLLGALSLLGEDEEKLLEDIIAADDYLKGKKGFKWYNSGRGLRVTYSSLAVFLAYSKGKGLGENIGANIVVTIAEEIIMLMILMIHTTNSANSSSSN